MENGFRYFLMIWVGEFISNIGTGMTAFALSVYVFRIENSATSVSLVVLAAFLPIILLAPIAGILADRYDRRVLMMLGDGLSSLGIFVILLAFRKHSLTLGVVLIGVVLSSVWSALLDPAYKATITDLLTEDEFAKASGLVQLAGASKYLLSPLLAGFLLTIVDIDFILLIDIGTLLITVVAVFIVKKQFHKSHKKKTEQHLVKEFKEGIETLTKHHEVLMLVMILSVVTFFIGFVQTLYTPMLLSITSEKVLGIIESISASGLLVGSLIISIKNRRNHYFEMMISGIIFMGIFIVFLGASTNLWMIGLSGFLLFASLPFINTSAEVLIRMNIPNGKQGRVWGLIGVISQMGYIVSYILSGVLADYIFNPLLTKGGNLANSVGKVIGTGEGRGIGLMFIGSGVLIIVSGFWFYRKKSIGTLEVRYDIQNI
jgi:MFS family permease